MDPLGKTVRNLLKQAHARQVKTARALADELLEEKMALDQVEEMLFASGFEYPVIDEVMASLPNQRQKK